MRKAFVLFGLMLLLVQVRSQVYVEPALVDVVSAGKPQYLIDDGGALTYSELEGAEFTDRADEALEALLKLNPKRVVWVKFDIHILQNPSELLALRTYAYSKVRCYLDDHGDLDSVDVGLADVGHTRHVDFDPFAIPIESDGPDTISVVLKISHTMRSALINKLGFELNTLEAYNSYREDTEPDSMVSSYFFIFFCGLLLFQIAYALFQWSLVRRVEYVYYALYLTAVFVYYYGRFSVYYCEVKAFSIIDAGMMMWYNDILLILPSFFYFRFARYFVDLSIYDPSLNLKFKRLEWFLLAIALVVLSLRIIPSDVSKSLPVFSALAVQFVFSVYAVYRISRQKRTIANFLVVGSLFALVSHVMANVMPFAFPGMMEYMAPVTLTMYGVLIEIAIFNTGLLFKARDSERDKVRVQAAYIEELKSRERLQAEYAGVRDKIASDLHDDIGSSLSSINIYSFAADERLARGDVEKTKDLLKSIGRSAGDTLNSMSDLVWVINPANDSTVKLIERIKAFAYEILSASDCSFQIDVDPDFYKVQLNQEQRKNILLILKEAVNNAAKYADATQVICRIIKDVERSFHITLSDNGIGLPKDLVPGNGLRTMRVRSLNLGEYFDVRSTETGTTVEFKVIL